MTRHDPSPASGAGTTGPTNRWTLASRWVLVLGLALAWGLALQTCPPMDWVVAWGDSSGVLTTPTGVVPWAANTLVWSASAMALVAAVAGWLVGTLRAGALAGVLAVGMTMVVPLSVGGSTLSTRIDASSGGQADWHPGALAASLALALAAAALCGVLGALTRRRDSAAVVAQVCFVALLVAEPLARGWLAHPPLPAGLGTAGLPTRWDDSSATRGLAAGRLASGALWLLALLLVALAVLHHQHNRRARRLPAGQVTTP